MSNFSCDPSEYTTHRPQYPRSLFKYLNEITNNTKTVLECAVGSGQASIGLARYFDELIAIDESFELLTRASMSSNILYIQSSEEKLPIKSNSVSLVCIAQGMHWFDLDEFYVEIKRVIKSKGIIAAWCYNKANINDKIDNIIEIVCEKISNQGLQSIQRRYVHENYLTIPFPFSKLNTPSFLMTANWNMFHLLGYIRTWPGVIEYQKKYNIDLVSEIHQELLLHWGDPENIKLISWPIHLLLGQIEK